MNCASATKYDTSKGFPVVYSESFKGSFKDVKIKQGPLEVTTLRNCNIFVTNMSIYIYSDYVYTLNECYRIPIPYLDLRACVVYSNNSVEVKIAKNIWDSVISSQTLSCNKEFVHDIDDKPAYSNLFNSIKNDINGSYEKYASLFFIFDDFDKGAPNSFYFSICGKQPTNIQQLSNSVSESSFSTCQTNVSHSGTDTINITEIKDLASLKKNTAALMESANNIKSVLMLARKNELVRSKGRILQTRQMASRVLSKYDPQRGINRQPTVEEIDAYVEKCEEERKKKGQYTQGEVIINKAEAILREIYGEDFDFEDDQLDQVAVSVLSKDTFKGTKNAFIIEMAKDISKILCSTIKKNEIAGKDKQLLLFTLPEAFAIYNRSRGLNTISPNEFNKAVDEMQRLTYEESPVFKLKLQSGSIIIIDKKYSVDMIGKDIIKILYQKAAEDSKNKRPMSGVSPTELGRLLGISNLTSELAKELFYEMERQKYVARASNIAGMTFFLNMFNGSAWKEVMKSISGK